MPAAIATVCAIAMALAFPKTNVVALAPIGAAGLFWAWFGLSPKRAFWVGWLAGTVFFALNFSWFGETAGALIAPFGFLLTLGPAVVEALVGFAIPGALVAFAAGGLARRERSRRALVPLAAAAVFAAFEWLRSEGLGPLGLPFASLGYAMVGSPLASVAPFAGTYAVTFLVCLLGAYAAYAIRLRAERTALADAVVAVLAVALCAFGAWVARPDRALPPATVRVAAIQGNIAQSIKFAPGSLAQALVRYETLTLRAAPTHPALVVWPETVMPTALNRYPALLARLASLATRVRTTLVVGTIEVVDDRAYNALYVFGPSGSVRAVYRKRQLVPFAERLPFGSLLRWIPWTQNVSNFTPGRDPAIFDVGGVTDAPVICWESDFSGLVRDDVNAGASSLIVATDDAWFGSSAGPYAHAQVARMRALETGSWIVRAASTGISGIVAPDGRFVRALPLGVAAYAAGTIGPGVRTPFDAIGPLAWVALFAIVYLVVVARARLA